MKDAPSSRVRFGAFELDLKTEALRETAAGGSLEGETRIVLPEQPFRLLLMLIERDGAMVTREEIRKKFWPNDTIVEFDHSINVAIGKLRKALGDSADEPRYIETVVRRGYRLLARVEWIGAHAKNSSNNDESPANEKISRRPVSGSGDEAQVRRDLPGSGLIGRKVSHYRVLEVIGGGGMGVVYKAEDLKLGRRVALKFLPEELSSDAAALQRFEREARTASSLNHPNICAIYEIEEHEGQPFIVMELLEGQTLRDRLAPSAAKAVHLDQRQVDQWLEIAIQICDGLQAAHQKGIIHRDIKPANIFLTAGGQVKILDFGLAKLMAAGEKEPAAATQIQVAEDLEAHGFGRAAPAPASGLSEIQPAADLHLTRTGSAMGTAGYMSPEQVRGEVLDARTDLFSFGLVLYEMFAGRRAFSGETAAVVHDAILNKFPVPVRELNSALPARLVSTIDKAMEKDRELRWQTAAEICAALYFPASLSVVPVKGWKRFRPFRLFAAAGVLLIVAGVGWYRYFGPGASTAFQDFSITKVTVTGNVALTAISADGKYMATTIANDKAEQSLWVNNLVTKSTRSILNDKAFRYVNIIFSPDTNYIYFSASMETDKGDRNDLYRIPLMGGEPARILADIDGPVTFFDNGNRVCFYRQDLLARTYQFVNASSEGGDEKVLATLPAPFPESATCSPDTRRAAVPRAGRIDIIDFSASTEKPWYESESMQEFFTSLEWTSDGRGLIVSSYTAANFSSQLKYLSYPSGRIGKITSDLNGYEGLSLTADGKALAAVQKVDETDLEIARFSETDMAPQAAPFRWVQFFDWINDEEIIGPGLDGTLKIADVRKNESRAINVAKNHFFLQPGVCGSGSLVASGGSSDRPGIGISRMSLDGGNFQELTSGPADLWPACTLDGKWIIYGNNQDSYAQQLMRIPATGGSPRKIAGSVPLGVYSSLSSDGKLLAVLGERPLPNNHWDYTFSLFSTETWQQVGSVALPADTTVEGPICFAPGNKSILFATFEAGRGAVWEQSMDGSPPKRLLSFTKTIRTMKLSPDGAQLGVLLRSPRSDAVLFRDNHQ